MKRTTKLVLSLSLAVAMLATMAFGLAACAGGTQGMEDQLSGTIAVIAKGETHAFWQSVKKGAVEAGQKYGFDVTFYGPPAETTENAVLQREKLSAALLDSKVKGVVIATVGTGLSVELAQCFDKGLPVVEFDSGLYNNREDITEGKDPVVASVASNNYKAAELAAEKFFEAVKSDIAGKSTSDKYFMYIMQHDKSQTGIDRAQGFADKFKALADADETTKGKYEVQIKELENKKGAYKEDLASIASSKKPDGVFMCNEGVVNEVYEEVSANKSTYESIKFCGFDAGTNQADWVEQKTAGLPLLVGSVAQDSYQIGYQAVEQCIFGVARLKTENVGLAGVWYNKDNIEQYRGTIVYEG